MVNTGSKEPGSSSIYARQVNYASSKVESPFECFDLETLVERMSWETLTTPERIDFRLIIACTKGSGLHEVDFELVELHPGRLLDISPGQIHRWIKGDYAADLILLKSWDESLSNERGPEVIEISNHQRAEIEPLVTLLKSMPESGAPFRSLVAVAEATTQWLQQLSGRGSNAGVAQQFLRLINEQVNHRHPVQFYSNALGCSVRTLQNTCAKAGLPSPKKLIDEATVLEAKRLLSDPDSTITEIAWELNFEETTNFTKFFKKHSGETPSQWKIANQN